MSIPRHRPIGVLLQCSRWRCVAQISNRNPTSSFSTSAAPCCTRLPTQTLQRDLHRHETGRQKAICVGLQVRCYSQAKRSYSREGGQFFYRIAASYIAKNKRYDSTKHNFAFDSETGQHWLASAPIETSKLRAKKKQSGQDACFISSVGNSTAAAFGVADGVGGWIDQGIDSAAFAHGICNKMADLAQNYPRGFGPAESTLSPLELLQVGYNLVREDESIVGGGSTVCLAVAEPQGLLKVANLGDSGFMQLRDNKVHHYSNPQTHAFNTPYQLSQIPPKILAQIEEFGRGPLSDMPKDASVASHELSHGDVLVFATDGVWDNLSSQDVLEVVSEAMVRNKAWVDGNDGTQVGESLALQTEGTHASDGHPPLQTLIATSVVGKAKMASMDLKRDGPFAKAVQKHFPSERYTGGKRDDICVVVAIALDGNQV